MSSLRTHQALVCGRPGQMNVSFHGLWTLVNASASHHIPSFAPVPTETSRRKKHTQQLFAAKLPLRNHCENPWGFEPNSHQRADAWSSWGASPWVSQLAHLFVKIVLPNHINVQNWLFFLVLKKKIEQWFTMIHQYILGLGFTVLSKRHGALLHPTRAQLHLRLGSANRRPTSWQWWLPTDPPSSHRNCEHMLI